MQPHQCLVSASNSRQGQLPSRPTDEYFGTGRISSDQNGDEDGDEDDEDDDDDDRGDSDGDNQKEKSSQPSRKGRRRRVAM